jgi:hypothetical protein
MGTVKLVAPKGERKGDAAQQQRKPESSGARIQLNSLFFGDAVIVKGSVNGDVVARSVRRLPAIGLRRSNPQIWREIASLRSQ